MSLTHITNTLDSSSLSPMQRLVMVALAENASPSGQTFPGMVLLGSRTGLSQPTLRSHLKSLEDNGWIHTISKGNGRGIISRWQLNTTRLENEAQATKAQRAAESEERWFPEKGKDSYTFPEDEKGKECNEKGKDQAPKGESPRSANRINRKEPSSEPVARKNQLMEERVIAEFEGLIPNLDAVATVIRSYASYRMCPASSKEDVLRAQLRLKVPTQRNSYGPAPAGGEVPPLRFAMDSPQNASNRGNARPREVVS